MLTLGIAGAQIAKMGLRTENCMYLILGGKITCIAGTKANPGKTLHAKAQPALGSGIGNK